MENRATSVKDRRLRLLLEGPIAATLFKLAAPNTLNILALTIIVTVDAFFVGRLGPAALGAVALVFPLKMLMQHIAASGMGGAVSSAIARARGAGQSDRTRALVVHALVIAVGMAALFGGLAVFGGRSLYQALGGRAETVELAVRYSNTVFGGAISVWLFNTLASIVRGTGNMTLPAASIAAVAILDLLLCPILVFGVGPLPALDIVGAGLAFIIAFAAGTGLLSVYVMTAAGLAPTWNDVAFRRSLFSEILAIGAPGSLNAVVSNLAVVLLTASAAAAGPDVLAGYGLAARLDYIVIPLAFAFGAVLVPMVAANRGAGQFERAARIGWTGAFVIGAATGVIGIIAAAWPLGWMTFFTIQGDVVTAGVTYLRTAGPFYALFGLALGLYFASQGAGRVGWPLLANVVRLIVVAGGAWFAVTRTGLGMTGVALAVAASLVAYAFVSVLGVWAGAWRRPPVETAAPHRGAKSAVEGPAVRVVNLLGLENASSRVAAAAVEEVTVRTTTVEGRSEWHRHGHLELVLVLRGRLRLETRGEAVEAGPGQILVVPADTEHRAAALMVESRVAVIGS